MKVKIMSESDAILHTYKTNIQPCIIVSITGETDYVPNFNIGSSLENTESKVKDIFSMHFEDIDYEITGYKEPRKEDFEGLKEFIDKYECEVEEIIVHCHAGISRSSACGAAICDYLKVDSNFIWKSGKYIPNRLVYKLAKEEFDIITSKEEFEELFLSNKKACMELCVEFEEKFKELFE